MRKLVTLALCAVIGFALAAAPAKARRAPARAQAPVPAGDRDQTLRALHDEMERSRTRLLLPNAEKPFYIEYRLLDLDVRAVTASFGGLVSS